MIPISKKTLVKKMLKKGTKNKKKKKKEIKEEDKEKDLLNQYFPVDDSPDENDLNNNSEEDDLFSEFFKESKQNEKIQDEDNEIEDSNSSNLYNKSDNRNKINNAFDNSSYVNSFFDNSNKNIDDFFNGKVDIEGNINEENTKKEVKLSKKQKKISRIIGGVIIPSLMFLMGFFVLMFFGIQYVQGLQTTAVVSLANPKYYAELGSQGLLGGQRQHTDIPDDLIGCEPDLNMEYDFNDQKKDSGSDDNEVIPGDSNVGKVFNDLEKEYKKGRYKIFFYKLVMTCAAKSGIKPQYIMGQFCAEQGPTVNLLLDNKPGVPSSHVIQDRNFAGIVYPVPDSTQGQPVAENSNYYARFKDWDSFAKNYARKFKEKDAAGKVMFPNCIPVSKKQSKLNYEEYVKEGLLNGNKPDYGYRWFCGIGNVNYISPQHVVYDNAVNNYINTMKQNGKRWDALAAEMKGKGYGGPIERSTYYTENLDKAPYEESFLKEYGNKNQSLGYGASSKLPKWRQAVVDHAENDFKNAKYSQTNRMVYGKSADCSSFVYMIYQKALGITFKEGSTTTTEEVSFRTFNDPNDLKPGDVIFYGPKGNTHHIAIFVGDGDVKTGFQCEMKDPSLNFKRWPMEQQWAYEKPSFYGTIVGTKYQDKIKVNGEKVKVDEDSDSKDDSNSDSNGGSSNQTPQDEDGTNYLTYSGYRTSRMHYRLNGGSTAIDDALIDSASEKDKDKDDEDKGPDNAKYDSKFDKELTKDPKYPYNPTKEEKWIIAKESGYRDGDVRKVGNPHAKNPNSDAMGIGQLMPYNYDAAFKGVKGYNGFDFYKDDAGKQLYAMRHYMKARYGSVKAAINFWKIHNYY